MATATGSARVSTEQSHPGWKALLRRPDVRLLTFVRGMSKLAGVTLSYAAMVYLAREGADQILVSIVGSAGYIAAFLFGLQGGLIADSLSKRVAIVFAYFLQAGMCFAIPIFFGAEVVGLTMVIFLSSAITQIISPALKASVALVASPEELAYVSAVVTVGGSLAGVLGSAVLGPLLIKRTSIETVLFFAGCVFLVGIVRALRLPGEAKHATIGATLRSVDWRPRALSLRYNARWIWAHQDISTMILVGAIVVAISEAFGTLMPIYVRDVLGADPAESIYIFAPAGLGFLIGTFLTPRLIGARGARRTAVVALLLMATSATLYGFIDQVAVPLAFLSPLRFLNAFFDAGLSDQLLAAGVIGIPANFGSTAAGAAIQTYLNSRVPIAEQGGVFGLQEVEENALTIFAVLSIGVVGTVFGPKVVFIVAPLIVTAAVVVLLRYASRLAGDHELSRREALHLLTHADEQPKAPEPP